MLRGSHTTCLPMPFWLWLWPLLACFPGVGKKRWSGVWYLSLEHPRKFPLGKLSSIIYDNILGDSESTHYRAVYKFDCCILSDLGHRLGLDPFCKVVHGYENEYSLRCGWWEWFYNVHSPLGEWYRVQDRSDIREWFLLHWHVQLAYPALVEQSASFYS